MSMLREIKMSTGRHIGTMVIAIVCAVGLFVVSYFVDNMPYWFNGGASVGQRVERWKLLAGDNDKIPDDLLLINVAYDRQLVEVEDEVGLPKGNIDITDREKLLRLLEQLEGGDYKYIVLDIILSDEYHTESDSALIDMILSMDNIVIAKSENTRLVDERLKEKARYTDYSTFILESNFVKYDYLRDGEPTLPYQVYLDLYGDSITNWGWFYAFKGKLANKSVVLKFPIKLWNSMTEESDERGEVKYLNLGADLLNSGVDVAKMAQGKIVVVGDFCENDNHDTYLGKIAGPIINLNAYYALVNDDVSIPAGEIVFVVLMYAIIFYCIFRRVSVSALIPGVRKINSGFVRFLLSFVGISTLLFVVAVIMYLLFKIDMSVLLPSICFTLLIPIMKYKSEKKK